MKFMSSKISLVVSSNDNEFIKRFIQKIFERPTVNIGKLMLIPKHYQLMDKPEFTTANKVCLHLTCYCRSRRDPELSQNILDPATHEFSDHLYTALADNMEKAGFSQSNSLTSMQSLNWYPIPNYLNKLNQEGRSLPAIIKIIATIR